MEPLGEEGLERDRLIIETPGGTLTADADTNALREVIEEREPEEREGPIPLEELGKNVVAGRHVVQDLAVQYTGDSLALVSGNAKLEATVWDSAANGYPATTNHPAEPGGTIGDITKMWIAFDIYTAANCESGTPTTKYAAVLDSGNGTSNDGIGTATTSFTSNAEGPYCVIVRLVDDNDTSNGTTNHWYSADQALGMVTFYNNTGQFVTGGGWIADPASGGNGKGNFGFNARYNKNGQRQGQMVYVWRGTYNGVAAICIIKSNSLTFLGFRSVNNDNNYPYEAALEGKATLQINRASDGLQLLSEGNGSFTAKAVEAGLPSSIDGDTFSLTFTRNGQASPYNIFPGTQLTGGNIVIHMK